MPYRLALLAAVFAEPAAAAFNNVYDGLADQMAVAAKESRARQAQFLPLVGADGSMRPEGRMVSGRLLSAIVNKRGLPVVLGNLPESVLQPYLSVMPVAQAEEFRSRLKPKENGETDLVIMGSYMVVRDKIKLDLQMVQVGTGRIIFAANTEVKNEWEGGWPELWEKPRKEETALALPAAKPTGEPVVNTAIVQAAAPAPPAPSPAAATAVVVVAAAPPAPDPLARLAAEAKLKTPAVKPRKAFPAEIVAVAAEAKSVELRGPFLKRSGGKLAMTKRADGKWTATVYLTPGEYRYRVLADGVDQGFSNLEIGDPNAPEALATVP